MNSPINLTAIFIANIMGLVILFNVAITNSWRFKTNTPDNRILFVLILVSALSCIADPICFAADGKPGMWNYFLVFWGNTWTYLANLILGPSWLLFVAARLSIRVSKLHKAVIFVLYGVGIGLLFVNVFTPIVFRVDAQNTYSRTYMYWYYLILQMGFLLAGLIFYFYARHKSGALKFFPVWAFVIPTLIGAAIQSAFYGVSTIWPFVALSIGCLTSYMHNELLFRDKLTGLYNRFYLNHLEYGKGGAKKARSMYFAIMLDVNNFKVINDTCGHLTGDEALIDMANILKNIIRENGEVIRYAGDEFIVILNTQDENVAKEIIARIRGELSVFNRESGKPYELTVSAGCCPMDLNENTIDEILNLADRLMYEDKKIFYERHEEFDRRAK